MDNILADLFYGEIRCHQKYEENAAYQAASLRVKESLQALEDKLKEEELACLRELDDAHAEMNAAAVMEAYIEGFTNAARLFTALMRE